MTLRKYMCHGKHLTYFLRAAKKTVLAWPTLANCRVIPDHRGTAQRTLELMGLCFPD